MGDQRRQIGKGQGARIDHQHIGLLRQHGDGQKICIGVKGQARVKRLVDANKRRGRDQKRVAIGFGPCKGLTSHSAAGAAAIINHNSLAERDGKPFAKGTGQDIGGAAGGEGYENSDGPIGESGRLGQSRGGEAGCEKTKAGAAGKGGNVGRLLLRGRNLR